MTFTEIVDEVQDRLNLTTSASDTRIGKRVNSVYKRVTSSLGINTSRRGTVSTNTVGGTATLAISIAKPEIVYFIASGSESVLQERTFDELRAKNVLMPTSGTPREYAVMSTTGTTVTLLLYPTPDAVLALKVDGLLSASTLSGSDIPAIPADFHDVLVYGAMVDELLKMEKSGLLAVAKADFEQRMSDLRYFLAKSAYLSITQGDRRGRSNLNNTNITIV